MTLPILTRKSEFVDRSSDGFMLLIDKPADWTSFDVCNKIRRMVGAKKVGHGGTLDPFATGLLVLGIGKGTKQLQAIAGQVKSYDATIRFGVATDSFDRTGNVVFEKEDDKWPTREKVEAALSEMTGSLMQTPPMFSAKKVGGKRLYKLARKGREIAREAVAIEVFNARLEAYDAPLLRITLSVSKGTYIRSYAVDLAAKLDEAAMLQELRRLSVGPYEISDAFTIEEFEERWKAVAQ